MKEAPSRTPSLAKRVESCRVASEGGRGGGRCAGRESEGEGERMDTWQGRKWRERERGVCL